MVSAIDVAKTAAEVIGYITVIAGFATVIIKPLRVKVQNHIRKISKTDEQEKRLCGLSEKIDNLINVMTAYVSKNDEVHNIILESIQVLKEGSAVSLGNNIKEIYNLYKEEKCIPEKEFEIVERMYTVYHDGLCGNGTVEHIHTEMKDWEVIIA